MTEIKIVNDEIKEEYELDQAEGVDDDSKKSYPSQIHFNTTFFGADYPVDTIVDRLNKDILFVPDFQRSYVWSLRQASRFIESILYGLPVPGIFLYREPTKSGRHLIIDGQQRLRTLQMFKKGFFREKKFRLVDVAEPWAGRTFDDLDPGDQVRFGDAIIHATIFRQEEPKNNDHSIYYVFERINTGGISLSSQEIRTCIYYGEFSDLLVELNKLESWRSIYGNTSKRNKDQELILRFIAFSFDRHKYQRPMSKFLNDFMNENRHIDAARGELFSGRFRSVMGLVLRTLGSGAFRPERNLNAAVFDSVMVGLSDRILQGGSLDESKVKERYERLISSTEFQKSYQRATADEESVKNRISLSVSAFEGI